MIENIQINKVEKDEFKNHTILFEFNIFVMNNVCMAEIKSTMRISTISYPM